MAGKSIDHTFSRNGNVSFREVGGVSEGMSGNADQYYVAPVSQDVHAVSYLSGSGHTLTVVLDFKTLKFAGLCVEREVADPAARNVRAAGIGGALIYWRVMTLPPNRVTNRLPASAISALAIIM
jgi:hypothetical protein